MPTIKGTASVADNHALLKQIRNTKFPKSFSTSVNLSRVHVPVMSRWIEDEISSILGFEDDIVQSTAVNLFLPQAGYENASTEKVDPRKGQLDMAGFLGEKEAARFAKELWELLIDAQTSNNGIPRKLLEEKKKELEKAKKKRTPEMEGLWVEARRRAEAARDHFVRDARDPARVSPSREERGKEGRRDGRREERNARSRSRSRSRSPRRDRRRW